MKKEKGDKTLAFQIPCQTALGKLDAVESDAPDGHVEPCKTSHFATLVTLQYRHVCCAGGRRVQIQSRKWDQVGAEPNNLNSRRPLDNGKQDRICQGTAKAYTNASSSKALRCGEARRERGCEWSCEWVGCRVRLCERAWTHCGTTETLGEMRNGVEVINMSDVGRKLIQTFGRQDIFKTIVECTRLQKL